MSNLRFLPLVLAAACAAPRSERPAPEVASPSVLAPELNERFLDPDLDVTRWLTTFEGESREIAVNRDAIVAALELTPGLRIADVGAGTGLFLEPFSRAVGPSGAVVAVDISEGFVAHMRERIEREGLSNASARLGGLRDAHLPHDTIDLAFVCDTYHHFDHPGDMLASLHAALVPGGRLAIVEFERIPGVSSEWVLGHVRAGKEEFAAEIAAAGFALEGEIELPDLRENYLLVFRARD